MAELIKPVFKIMLLSDHKSTGPLYSMSLQQNNARVFLEVSIDKALQRAKADQLDLILVDLSIADRDLLKLIHDLRAGSSIPILLLTSNRSEDFLVKAYDQGVDECIQKPIGPSLFQAKVKVWLSRRSAGDYDSGEPVIALGYQLHPAQQLLIFPNGGMLHLTNLEVRLLYNLMSHPGRVVKIDVLIEQIWGSCGEADTVALKNIVYRLRKKMETEHADPQVLQTATGVGYQFGPDRILS